jgi:hypothetical protein
MPSAATSELGNTSISAILSFTFTWGAATANTTSEQSVTIPGLVVGDWVNVVKPTFQAGIGVVGCRVSAANTLAVAFVNGTGGGITPTASDRYILQVVRFENQNVNNPPSALV